MTVRAVDMQTMIPRLNEASRMQHQNDVRPQVAQHAQTQVVQAQAQRAQQQVQQTPQSEQGKVRRDGGRREGGGQHQSQARGDRKGQQQETPAQPGVGGRLDIKV